MKSVHGHDITEHDGGMLSSTLEADYTLMPNVEFVEDMVKVLTENCDEYGGDYSRGNWLKGSVDVHLAHALNHVLESKKYYQRFDSDKAKESLTHAATRLWFVHSILTITEK